MPVEDERLLPIREDRLPIANLTTYDVRRIEYKERAWRDTLGVDTGTHIGAFDDLDACKSLRARLRRAMARNKLDAHMKSNCFRSRSEADTAASDEKPGEGAE